MGSSGLAQVADQAPFNWRIYVTSLLRRWPLILLVACGFALAAYGASLLLMATAPSYQSEALVMITRPRYQVELESKIKSNDDPLATSNMYPGTMRSRGETLAILARSSEIEQAVQQKLANRLSQEDMRPQHLLNRIRVRPNNELLRISATATDPELAADLANAWADEIPTRFTSIYGASAGTPDVDAEVENARRAYETANQALYRFLVDNPVENLNRQMQAKIDDIKQLESQRVGALKTTATNIFVSLAALNQLIRDAETLRAQVVTPTQSRAASAGDALALITLRSRSYLPSTNQFLLPDTGAVTVSPGRAQSPDASSGTVAPIMSPVGPPSNVQVNAGGIDFPSDSTGNRVADLDSMIQALRARRAELQDQVDALSQRMLTGSTPTNDLGPANDDVLARLDDALTQATADVQRMRADVSDLDRRREDLTNRSNVLGSTYKTLVNKAQELRVLKATTGGEGVTVVAKAMPPLGPSWPRPVLYAGVAGLVGLLCGCALALSMGRPRQPSSVMGVGGVLRPTASEPGS